MTSTQKPFKRKDLALAVTTHRWVYMSSHHLCHRLDPSATLPVPHESLLFPYSKMGMGGGPLSPPKLWRYGLTYNHCRGHLLEKLKEKYLSPTCFKPYIALVAEQQLLLPKYRCQRVIVSLPLQFQLEKWVFITQWQNIQSMPRTFHINELLSSYCVCVVTDKCLSSLPERHQFTYSAVAI